MSSPGNTAGDDEVTRLMFVDGMDMEKAIQPVRGDVGSGPRVLLGCSLV